jgi:MFS family permease
VKESLQESGSIWGLPDIRVILPARALSTAGSALTMVAAVLHLHGTGSGPVVIAALMACVAIPTIATMGVAGHVADRYDSRTVLLLSTTVQVIACVVLGIWPNGQVIFVSLIIIQLGQAFSQPTWSALLPRVVGEDRIAKAISWQQGLTAAAAPAGTAAGGLIVGLWDLRWAFWIDACSFALLIIAVMIVRTRRRAVVSDDPGPKVRWSAGIAIVRTDAIVWPLFTALLVFVILVEGINPAEIFLARDALGASPVEYGFSDAFAGAGAVLGAFLAGRIAGVRRWVRAAVLGFGLSAVALVLAGLAPSFWVYVALLAGLTTAFSIGNATFGALLMTRTPDADRGKVQAALGGMARTCSLIALAIGGFGTSLLGPRITFVLAGVAGVLVMIAAGLLTMRSKGDDPVDETSDDESAPVRS